MSALAALQHDMQAWLLHGDPPIAAHVQGELRPHRLRIYADAYRLRLLDVLGQDYPATKAVLGEEAFEALGADYLRAHPSAHPSVRHVGHAFAQWLSMRHGVPRHLHQLARFEWAQGEAFDAADAPLLAIEHIHALPADAWPALRLRLQPGTRRLALQCNAPALAAALAGGRALPALRAHAPGHWLVWRSVDGGVQWRRLDADEAAALDAVAAGEPFARLCERMTAFHGDGGALRAASLLKRWLADGLLAAPFPH